MKSKYLERIEQAYKQFELFSVKKQVNNGDYLVLFRNANQNYDIGEWVTNDGNFAGTIFDRWCENARLFKSSNNNGIYIIIILLKQNYNYQLINDYRIWGAIMYITEKEYSTKQTNKRTIKGGALNAPTATAVRGNIYGNTSNTSNKDLRIGNHRSQEEKQDERQHFYNVRC